MTKSLTEKWKDDTLTDGYYYTKKITYPETYPSCDEHIIESIDLYGCDYGFDDDMDICEVLAPVPSYEEFVQQREFVKDHQNVLIENMNLKLKVEKLERRLYDKDQGFISVLNIVLRNIEREQRQRKLTELELSIKSQVKGVLGYNGLVSNSDESVQKMHILEKKLAIATKALGYYAQCKHINLDLVTIPDDCAKFEAFDDGEHARQALKEMEGVK